VGGGEVIVKGLKEERITQKKPGGGCQVFGKGGINSNKEKGESVGGGEAGRKKWENEEREMNFNRLCRKPRAQD